MLDHLTVRLTDYAAGKAFFTAALAPLGYAVLMAFDLPGGGQICGLGEGGKPDLWLAPATAEHPAPVGQHLAFQAKGHAQVDAFHAAAIAAGATDDGAPGGRAEYHPDYYGAFVVAPNGMFLEACTHHAE